MSDGSASALAALLEREPRLTIVVGCGGFGAMVLDLLLAADPNTPVAFADDAVERIGKTRHDAPIFGPIDACLDALTASGAGACVIAIANNGVRRRIAERHPDAPYITVVHPRATVSPLAELGTGSIILPGACVDPEARIGAHVVLNKLCSIGHNCTIDDFAQLAPLVGSGGHLGAGCFVGMGASVLPGVRIGQNAVVGAGAVVAHDVPDGATVVGIPARVRDSARAR